MLEGELLFGEVVDLGLLVEEVMLGFELVLDLRNLFLEKGD